MGKVGGKRGRFHNRSCSFVAIDPCYIAFRAIQ